MGRTASHGEPRRTHGRVAAAGASPFEARRRGEHLRMTVIGAPPWGRSRLTLHVPTHSVARCLRSSAITDSAVINPVLGFSDGMFSMPIENRAESASTSMR